MVFLSLTLNFIFHFPFVVPKGTLPNSVFIYFAKGKPAQWSSFASPKGTRPNGLSITVPKGTRPSGLSSTFSISMHILIITFTTHSSFHHHILIIISNSHLKHHSIFTTQTFHFIILSQSTYHIRISTFFHTHFTNQHIVFISQTSSCAYNQHK